MAHQTTPRVAFLGLGVMGKPMASNLLKAGFPVTVWNRTATKTQPLQDAGASVATTPAQAATDAQIIITIVAAPRDVEQVVLGPQGVVEGLQPGSIVVDMSTVSPATSRKLAEAVAKKQAEFLDAPVVGSKGPATTGELVILVGGPAGALERCRPLFTAMGKTVVHAGEHGCGSALKLATNLMLAHLVTGFSEALLLVERSGINPQRYQEVLDASTFHSPWFRAKGVGIRARDFSTHFALKHMHKDLRLMGEVAGEVGTALSVTKALEQLFARAEADGRAELDYSAIFATLDVANASAGSRETS